MHMISRLLGFWIGILRFNLMHLMKVTGNEVCGLRGSRPFVYTYPMWPRELDKLMCRTNVNAHLQRLSPDLPVWLTCNLL